MRLDRAHSKADRLLAERKRKQAATDLSEAVYSALSPEFAKLITVIRKRLAETTKAITELQLTVPDKVEIANAIRIDETVKIEGQVTDPQLKALSAELIAVRKAIERERSVTLSDGTSVALEGELARQLLQGLTGVSMTMRELFTQELRLGLLTNNADPKYFLPVRLTDGSDFYNAKSIASFGGGGGSSDGLTDVQLRASAVSVDTGLTQPTTPADTQPVSAASLPLPSGAATAANQQTDALTDAELRATPIDIADPNKQDALPYAEILTASATITPSSGTRIRLLKAQVLQSPANETYNVVSLNFTSLGDVVTGWAYSDSNEWIGAVDEVLNITLTNANPVSVNIRYKEI